ncbi:MAG: cellulase family glycosylhydrolase [Eubacterium sp.]|nr:cellulase family glycosylhydrolase [Eubacterium sp.]
MKKSLVGSLTAGLMLSAVPVLPASAKGVSAPAGFVSAYDSYGDLMVAEDGATGYQQLCDEAGNPVQLRGMSTFGLQWGDGNWVLNDDAFDALAYDWNCDIIRLAMYVSEGGYADDPAAGLARVEQGIQLATERGMYVLVDWHMLSPGDPTSPTYLNAGVDLPEYAEIKAAHPEYTGPQLFFAYLSEKYGAQGNVLFETANEPNGNGNETNAEDTWKNKLLPYHQGVVDAIREYDADDNPNIVICGTDNWSQFVDAPVANPVVDPAVADGNADDDQIMYTFHFYAGTHDTAPEEDTGDYWLGSKIKNALEGGIAVFCTEWGTSEATGDGGPYINYSDRWLDFMEDYKISWCSWSLALKNEISAAMQGKAAKNPTDNDEDGIPDWDSETDLSITGNYVRAKIREEEAPMYGASEIVADFEDGLPLAIVLGDSPVPAADYPLAVEELADGNKVLSLGDASGGVWSGPRISFQDLGNVYSLYSDLTFDVYLPDGTDLVNGKLEIQPIIQTAALGWWGQISQVTLTADDFTVDEATGLKKATAKVNYDDKKVGGDKLGHITFLIGDTEGIYLDNVGLETWYNGDIADAPVIPDEPGTFVKLPFDFESGQREGWKPEGTSTIDYTTIAVEEVGTDDMAMSFPVKLEAGKNEWEDGVRLSSPMGIFEMDNCKSYDALAMNVYLEKGKATTGEIQIEVCSTPNGMGYWYQSGGITLDPVNGGTPVTTPGGRELVKYNVYVPLNNEGADYGLYPFSNAEEEAVIRNIILALHNADSDYEGRIYYDNIRYVDAEKLDDIDTEYNFDQHVSRIVPLAAAEEADDIQVENALKALLNPMMTNEKFAELGVDVDDIIAKAEKMNSADISKDDLKAIAEKYADNKGNDVKAQDEDKKEDQSSDKKDASSDKKDEKKEEVPSNEWKDGKWYDADGKQTYEAKGEWKSDEYGWWFEDESGWFPVSCWQKIDGKWYYFTNLGYMDYGEYRDGCWLGDDGAWVEEYYGGHWMNNSKGWWYEDESGWYPQLQWVWIDGSCYYFEADGFMATSKYVGGFWVGADGAFVK